MNKEAYVSFKVAELLKDKGFNWECRSFYEYFSSMITMYQGMLPELSEAARNYNKEKYKDICSRPTQQMACRWLREVYNIHIGVFIDIDKYAAFLDEIPATGHTSTPIEGDFISYEDAVEAALEYVLTNLI